MKTFATLSASLIFYLLLLQTGMTSCTKEEIKTDTVTVIKKDTIYIKDTAVSLAIITANPWKIQEDRGVVGGSLLYYLRGGSNNTQNFDNEYIVFNANKTGTHFENNGIQRPITWDFANADQTKLIWTLSNTPATFSITWDNLRYKNKSLHFDQYYTDGNTGNHAHSHQIRIPK
jgi:hypothetical protein